MYSTICLWIGSAICVAGGIAILAAAITGAAYLCNFAVRQVLDAYGGWEVFLEYRDWYNNRKDRP